MSKSTSKTFVIIDGYALVHRSFHALPPFTTKDGTVVNAVYGVTSIILKLLKEIDPEYMVVCFDRAEKTFRHEQYEDYKATRVKQADELYEQIPLIYDVLDAFRIAHLDKAGYEADDLIGTLAKHSHAQKGIKTAIVTGDLDTLQLVDDKTSIYTTKKGISEIMIYDEDAVMERYGLKPDQLIDYKALRGDPSDNIPGVKGIGEKTAISLIQKHGTLENLYKKYQEDDSITPRIKKLLEEGEKAAFDSQDLVTIRTDVSFKYDLKSYEVEPFDRDKVIELFMEFQFKSLIEKIPKLEEAREGKKEDEAPSDTPFEKEEGVTYTLITEKKDFEDFLSVLKKQDHFAFDTETTSLDHTQADLLGISISFKEKEAYYIVIHETDFLKELKPIFEDKNIKKIAHNAKYDILILRHQGIDVQGLYFDTMIASYLTSPTRSHGLDNLAFVEFGHEMIKYEDLVGKGKKQIPLLEVPIEQVSWYACEDVDYTYRLYPVMKERLKEHEQEDLFHEIEIPLIEVLLEMEFNGMALDVDLLKKLSKKHAKEIAKLEESIYEQSGMKFNINSPAQLKEVLFDHMGISTEGLKKTKTGISTAAPELEKLRKDNPIVESILKYREYVKLKSTYIDALPKLVSKKTGRIHTSFNQTIAATGRLSSSDPNLQNIPIKTDVGNEIRKAFVAEKGYVLADLDYSQIELRIVASLAQADNMIQDFKDGVDIHTSTAARVHGISMQEVTTQMRREAKAINFGLIYGMGYVGLSAATGISSAKAKAFIKKYFEQYPAIYEYIRQAKEEAHDLGYAKTIFGRRRYLPDLYSGMPQLRAAAERMAINMPVQGSNADIIKKAMISIFHKLPKISPDTKMLLQVHDDLVFAIPKKDVEKVIAFLKKEMEGVVKLEAPLVVSIHIGDNWGEMSDYEV